MVILSKNDEFKEKIIALKERFEPLHANQFVDLESGEILTKDEMKKIQTKRTEEIKLDFFDDINKISLTILELENQQRVVNKRSKKSKKDNKVRFQYKSGYEFNKVFRDKIKEGEYMKLDKNEKLAHFVLRDFVSHPSNAIVIDGKIPKVEELAKICSLSKPTLTDALVSLEEKGLIKRVQEGKYKMIYFSPEYYSGGWVDGETLELFGLEPNEESDNVR